MSMFYGQVKGQSQTAAARRGSAKSGIRVSAQSWNGSIITEMTPSGVSLYISDESSDKGALVFHGSIDDLRRQLCSK